MINDIVSLDGGLVLLLNEVDKLGGRLDFIFYKSNAVLLVSFTTGQWFALLCLGRKNVRLFKAYASANPQFANCLR